MGKGAEKKEESATLNYRQQMFVLEYLVDLNAKQAAIRVGYSAKTAEVTGSKLLSNAKVAAEIQKAMDKRAAKIEITADKVLEEVARMAFANLQDFYNEDGSLKPIHSLPREVAAALSSIKTIGTEATIQEVKLHDKKGNLELLGKNLMLWKDVGSKDNPLEANINEMSETEKAARIAALLATAKDRKDKT